MSVLRHTVFMMALCAGVPALAAAPIPPAKQALIDKMLSLWHMDSIGQSMLQAPVTDAVAQARAMLQGRASAERRDAAMTEIVGEAQKFMDDATPTVRASAQKLIPSKVAPLLAERFTEDELRQMVAILESPVKQKFEKMLPELQKSLGEGVAADTGPVINPKLQDLKQRIGMRLRSAVTP
ncbi:DUF2059 domain-containing protein [Pseudoduganella sp. UC29_71]|uniref:DUF2059 domain-containing protein n=1 Tax=Pseudoduganella sp. UC29_71 TaxID=3350174 RepID=UPI003670CE55